MKTENNDLELKEVGKEQDNPCPIDFTEIIGGTGKWQIRILIMVTISGIPAAWNHLAMSFLAFPVDHWCERPQGSNISLDIWFKEFLPNTTLKGKVQHSQCEMFVTNHSAVEQLLDEAQPCEKWEFSTEYYSLPEHFNVVCNNEWQLSLSQTVYMLGFLFAVLICGQLADLYGRHPIIMANVVILLVAGIAAVFSNSFIMFTICRFFIGFGHAGLGMGVFVLVTETIGSVNRAKYAIVQYFGWHFGYLILPLFAWLIPNWLYLQLIITLPCVTFLSFYWLLPESPRWLLSNGNFEKALPILQYATKINGVEVPDLELQVKKICVLIDKDKKTASTATIIDLLKTPKMRKRTLSLYFIWVAIAFTYYGLSLNTNELEGNDFLNFFLSGVMEIPATLFCILTLDRFGRKKIFILTLLIGGISCSTYMFVPESLWSLRNALAMTGKLCVSASFCIVYLYSAEIFPTVVRNIGLGSCSTMARIGSAVTPFLKELGKATDPAVPLGLFGAFSIISALLVLKLPETNKQSVPETIEQAENFKSLGKN